MTHCALALNRPIQNCSKIGLIVLKWKFVTKINCTNQNHGVVCKLKVVTAKEIRAWRIEEMWLLWNNFAAEKNRHLIYHQHAKVIFNGAPDVFKTMSHLILSCRPTWKMRHCDKWISSETSETRSKVDQDFWPFQE